jgi:fatty acid desaturase
MAPEVRPPARLNLLLISALIAGGTGLQVLASRAESGPALLAYGLCFSFLYLPLYSLLHEAEHLVLHPDPRWNDRLGVLLGIFFGGAFTFLRACHLGHHRRNRSDAEMFDLYYPGENLLKKRAFFYFNYLGGFWVLVPITTCLFLLVPGFARLDIIQRATSASAMINGVPRSFLRRIRGEALGMLLIHGALIYALDLNGWTYLILYSMYGINWSCQQYVTHAASPRQTLDGAHNLLAHPLYAALLLNFNWHLAHHQHPKVPWIHLPHFDDPTRVRPPYLRAFLRFWRGPQPCQEPSPRAP